MANFLVLGAGKMGIVLAKDLIESDPQNKVTLVDKNSEQLKRAAEFIQSKSLTLLKRDMEDKKQREEIFKGQDVALCALLHKHSLLALETAVWKGCHFVDLVGEWPLERLKYDKDGKKKGITVISGIGVSPGITNVCVGRAVRLLDETEKALIYVGGNPVEPKLPLNYRIVYAIDSLLNFYERNALIFKGGKEIEVPPLSEVERIAFPPDFPEMECFYTDGLNSLLYTMRGKILDELAQKTIRHKGHAEGIATLKACGLFSTKAIRIGNQEVIPRRVLEELLDSRMRLEKERDVTLLRIVVSGKKRGKLQTHVFEMIDHYDSEKNYSSMAKTTSFPASIAAQMIVSGEIRERGALFPENVFHDELYELFVEELKKRGVVIHQKTISDR
jgi:lysine 6-dehydrogenase